MTAKQQIIKTPLLDSYGKDLTQLASQNKLDPIVGRLDEIKRCSLILARRKKNNPILIGEPGVGKTAIIEGLATKIVEQTCPPGLFGKRLIALELSNLVAGTKYRGEFEERIEQIISEVTQSKNIILFIDEIHTLVGAGSASGSLDAANILKPALARGEIQCIGATTINEYRKTIEKDGALNRRFQQVLIEPNNLEETRVILENIKEYYENYHNVTYTKEALDECVRLSDRYIQDRFLPDKAIDLLDEAGAIVNVEGISIPPTLKKLEEKVNTINKKKLDAVKNQKFELAAKYRDQVIAVTNKIAEDKLEWEKSLKKNKLIVDHHDIAKLVSNMIGMPITKLTDTDFVKLQNMDKILKSKIIGQDLAIDKITKALKRSRVGLKNKKKPIGTFLFTGKSGVGKSELAKQLAIHLFGSIDDLIRIDMSEYSEKFTVSKLTGAPPGYIGYDDGSQLTERVRRKPYSIILLDEIEKADPSIFNVLLQVLDDGRLTDSHGKVTDFKNTIIIMTSNIGVRTLQDFGTSVGFTQKMDSKQEQEAATNVINKSISKLFPPEFINRIDEIITFNSLTKEDIHKILDIELIELKDRLKETNFTMELTKDAKDFIVSEGYDDKFGARPLRRAIQTHIEDLIASNIIDMNIKEGQHIIISKDKKENSLSISTNK